MTWGKADKLAREMILFMHEISYSKRTNQLSEAEKAIFSKVYDAMKDAYQDYSEALSKRIKEAAEK